MERIFTISNQYILSLIVSQYLQTYITTRKLTQEVYLVARQEGLQQIPLMYVYDCKIFRSSLYHKDQNNFLSAFLICYKENETFDEAIYQFLDARSVYPSQWTLKVKESSILRIYTHLQQAKIKLLHRNDCVILPEHLYFDFMQTWLKCNYSYTMEASLSNFFRGILALLDNQILLEYYKTLTEEQKRQRKYKRPIRYIEKPTSVQQFTLIEQPFGEVKWQTLKITAYKLKYRIVEQDRGYHCYRIEQQAEQLPLFQELSIQDRNILLCFEGLRQIEEQYQRLY